MRNWNKKTFKKIRDLIKFLQYLWGIETCHVISVTNMIIVSFYSTYEELKRFLIDYLPINNKCFYSTYEELKHVNCCRHPVTNFSFYSTYEELKLGSSGTSTSKSSCFYSTYEELKHTWYWTSGLLDLSFYSTYEELKLLILINIK